MYSAHVLPPPGLQGLEDRRVLAVHRDQGGAAALHERHQHSPGDDQRFLVSQPHVNPALHRGQRSWQSCGADDGRKYETRLAAFDELDQPAGTRQHVRLLRALAPQVVPVALIRDGHVLDVEPARLLGEQTPFLPRRQPNYPDLVPECGDDLECGTPDRPSRAEDGHTFVHVGEYTGTWGI